MALDPTIARDLKAVIEKLSADGRLLPKATLDGHYSTFRARFGPEALRALEGPTLLDTLHNTSNASSLAYWLEFKNDAEFPAIFGSIAGGSALKFGLYRRKETNRWMTGHPTAQREMTEAEAIAMATRNRDQLVAGAAALDALSAAPESVDYDALQTTMQTVAPDVAETAWGHKYFSVIAPTLLDDYHAPSYQRFQLIKMLIGPPKREGRYVAAAGFLGAARELGVPLTNLGTALNERNGSPPHRYWRIGTGSLNTPRGQWPMMQSKSRVVLGWKELGDLSTLEPSKEAREALRKKVEAQTSTPPTRSGHVTNFVFRMVHDVKPGDVIVAADGDTNLAIGRVTGGYAYDAGEDFAHFHAVEWLDLGEWKFPSSEGLMLAICELRKYPANLIAIERRLTEMRARVPKPTGVVPRRELAPLGPLVTRIRDVLTRKGQVILYGPPGTGKTHHAIAAARELASRAWFGVSPNDLSDGDRRTLLGGANEPGVVETCCFHPAYGYEDFLEGYRPRSTDGALGFDLREGVFKRLCRRAAAQPERPFYLIIDEINRGDIPRIFGELLMVIERTRRGDAVVLPLSGERFVVPPNVFVIGTMNTADRSIALLDTALRRRFGFVELMPDATVLGDAVVAGIPLGPWLDALNARILRHAGRDARNLQVGHSYLLHGRAPVTDLPHLAQVLRDDIIPLIEEYCYEDYSALERILGSTLVLKEQQRIDHRLFDPSRGDDLVRALLEPCPEITTSPLAIAQEAREARDEVDDDVAGGA